MAIHVPRRVPKIPERTPGEWDFSVVDAGQRIQDLLDSYREQFHWTDVRIAAVVASVYCVVCRKAGYTREASANLLDTAWRVIK